MPNLNYTVGGTSFPLDPNDYTETLAPLDPARDAMLALFKDAVNAELEAVWDKVTVGTPLDGTDPVADTWPGPPDPEVVLQRKCGFPCLFLSREGTGSVEEYSLAEDRLIQQWGLHYVLSPVDLGDFRKIGDSLIGAVKVVVATVGSGGHPAHESGALVFEQHGLTTVRVLNYQAGRARFAPEGPQYMAMSMTLETAEITTVSEADAVPLTGATIDVGTGGSEGILPSVVVGFTEEPIQYG